MKAKDLIKQLSKHPDFEVEFSIFEKDNSEYGAGVRTWIINGIGDIGHSDKIIKLDSIEEK